MAAPLSELVKKESKEAGLKAVQLDGQVVLKIMQHCNEALPHLVTGQLLGLDVGQTLEVTDCFPFPASVGDEDGHTSLGASYQLDMMRSLREVNVDNNTVGWYQSTVLGSFQTAELIETFANYYENIKKCVCLVYDPHKAQRGSLGMKAIRLKDSFIEVFKEHKTSGKELREANLSWKDVFQDIPIKIHNSSLIQALVTDLEPEAAATQGDFDRLNLSVVPFLSRNVEQLIECVDELAVEQQSISHHHRAVARQAAQMAQWLARRRQENTARRAAGEEPLPEEDATAFRPIPEPSQLETYLVNNQLANFADQVHAAATQSLERFYVMEALQKAYI